MLVFASLPRSPFSSSERMTLTHVHRFWINERQPNSVLWAHEFSKHATCFSTFDIPCYGPLYRTHEDVVDYFETTIAFDRQLPTWDWLAGHGILPSNYTSYTLGDIRQSLKEHYGAVPYIGCSGPKHSESEGSDGDAAGSADDGNTILSEVWYFSHVCLTSFFRAAQVSFAISSLSPSLFLQKHACS